MNSNIGLEAFFEYATEGILVTNPEGEVVKINPAAEAMFGYAKGELLGQKIEKLIPARFAAGHEKHREEFNIQSRPRAMGLGMNLYALRKDGSEFPVEVSLSPFESPNGKFIIAFVIDITIRKEQDDVLQKTTRDLQFYIQELKASNAELENFAYISSHDLQEPLRKIQAFGDRLKMSEEAKLSELGKDYLNRMLNAANRMQTLIDDLLTFSRLASRSQPFTQVNLNSVLKGVLSDLEISIEKSGAKIEVEELPVIEAEATQMRQLFQNLLSNAIKFRKDDVPVVIKVYSRPSEKEREEGRESIDLFVEDNGIGFEEKYNDRIFNIFQRLEGVKYEGSGIGLAICRKIAMRHGGNIIAKSEPGKGSTFIVTLARKQRTN